MQQKKDFNHIAAHLQQFAVPLESLSLDEKNPRKHSDRNIQALAESLRQFKQQTPIVVNKEHIILKGNATYKAAQLLGWDTIAAVMTDLETRKQETAYKITDNKTGDLADWFYDIVAEEIKLNDDMDWEALGWDKWELDPILQAEWKPPAIDDLPTTGSGKPTMKTIAVTTEQYEVIQRAINKCQEDTGDEKMSEGRALELICGDYLGG